MRWDLRLAARLQRVVPRVIHGTARFTRPLTMGVRAVILDRRSAVPRVFLVRHSYVAGWHLPGGAVEPGESVGDCLRREVREECAIAVAGTPRLFGIYFNRKTSRRDHVAVYVVEDFQVLEPRRPDWEIVEAGFFGRERLPHDATAATRARLAEVLDGQPAGSDW
jgi:ADP-ribose pyrophosphatase YjhB (NUDIX family)